MYLLKGYELIIENYTKVEISWDLFILVLIATIFYVYYVEKHSIINEIYKIIYKNE